MAKFKGGSKPKNQGSAGTPKIQKPATSSAPGRDTPAPQTAQKHRGFHSGGVGGSKPGPKPFK